MIVYILQSEVTHKYYCGQTQDLQHRLTRHNSCLEPSTKGGVPWKIRVYFEVNDRSEAVRLERKIKSRGIKRYMKDHGV